MRRGGGCDAKPGEQARSSQEGGCHSQRGTSSHMAPSGGTHRTAACGGTLAAQERDIWAEMTPRESEILREWRTFTPEDCEMEHNTFVTVKQTFNSPTVINCLQSLLTQTCLVKEGQTLRGSSQRLPSALGRALCPTAASAPPLPKKACKDSCNSPSDP